MPRPTSLTPQVQKRLCEALAAGNYKHVAARHAGIGKRTLYTWLARGRAGRGKPYVALLAAADKAANTAIMRNVAAVQLAARGGQVIDRRTITRKDGTVEVVERFARIEWTAAAWWLERNYPQLYSLDRDKLRQVLKDLAQLKVEIERLEKE